MDRRKYSKKELNKLLEHTLDCHEFQVYLQPKYELKTMKIVAAEALIRWMSASRGLLQPNDFIPYFEKTGFIIQSDFYMLEEVCKKIRYWLENGIVPVKVSVNQSRVHVHDEHYIEHISQVIKKYQIPAKMIELELTESMFMSNGGKLIEVMEQLRSLGFIISIDDFGSGYSSLNLLDQLPVDILKLDKAFLNNMKEKARSHIVISQIIEMAHKLGMQVVCEGVEKESQAEFLKEMDCDMVQGYLYAKPMPIDRFDQFRNVGQSGAMNFCG